MRLLITSLFFYLFLAGCNSKNNTLISKNLYPEASERILSKENTTYYINPVSGNDENLGTKKEAPWKTFYKLNQLILTKGNKVEILSPGTFRESLHVMEKGTKEAPIIIKFAPGKYDFFPENFYKNKFDISNTNDSPDALKRIAINLLNSEHIKINGNDAEVILRGKTIVTSLNNCKNISIEKISFDYKRPTVSELKVLSVNDSYVDVQVHNDSKYKIKDSALIWIGEGWEHKAENLWQEFNPTAQKVKRKSMSIGAMRFSELNKNTVRISFKKNPGFTKGLIYQNRNTFRDYSAVFMQESKNILWENVTMNFMHGMGFVSQFCENITYNKLFVKPKEGSGRSCAAWADILHFSGCKGEIKVLNSYLSAANDDAINVHGTYLRIIDSISKRKVKVRFMHPQTYGFNAFFVGDSIEFIRAKSLLPFSKNVISKVTKLNEKEIELVFKENIPNDIEVNDVIENISWTADITIQHNKIAYIPTRGILITTRGKVIVENNEFLKTQMSGILIAADANSWFESGATKDVTISNNTFIDCGMPVINIHPENSEVVPNKPVHENIQIINNQFNLDKQIVLSAKSTENIKFTNNIIDSDINLNLSDLINTKSCSNVEIRNNKLHSKKVKNTK